MDEAQIQEQRQSGAGWSASIAATCGAILLCAVFSACSPEERTPTAAELTKIRRKIFFHDALAHEDGTVVAREFRKELDTRRASLLKVIPSQSKADALANVDLFYAVAREPLQGRFQDATSEWQVKAMEAPPKQQEEMRAGLKAIMDVLKDLETMQKADREEVTRLSKKS